MQLEIDHRTRYAYDQPVDYALQKVRLRPLSSPLQEMGDWSLDIAGGRIEASYLDHYGNHVDLVSADPGTSELTLTANGSATTRDSAGILGTVYGKAPLWHFAQATEQTKAGAAVTALVRNTWPVTNSS